MEGDVAVEKVGDIVDAGRTISMQLLFHYGRVLSSGEAISYALVPHKSCSVGSEVLRTCRSIRSALVFSPSGADDNIIAALLYAYTGGGVPYQPPNTYALVFKHMPLRVARRALALLLYHTGAPVDETMFVCKQSSNQAQQLSSEEKRHEVELEVESVHDYLSELNAEGVQVAVQLIDRAVDEADDVEVDCEE
jgi:hypothetical protein